MIRILNQKLKHLGTDNEGFAMALTLVVWPVLFLMVCGVFVTGESIRQKIILQNATDAAVRAGALVHADTLSRIAVLNRMMSWTYIQANKMEMDCVVSEWLTEVDSAFTDNKTICETENAASTCTEHIPLHKSERSEANSVNYGWYTGVADGTDYKSGYVQLNGLHDVEIANAQNGFDYGSTKAASAEAYSNIEAMNGAITDLRNNASSRIETVMTEVLNSNLAELGVPAANFSFVIPDLAANTEIMTDETAFLALNNASDNLSTANGFNTWWVADTDATGFRREYSDDTLTYRYDWGYNVWTQQPDNTCTLTKTDSGTVSSFFVRDTNNANTISAKPVQLTSGYADTKILAGVKMPLKNPLADIFADTVTGTITGSWFDAYTVADTDVWSVSAARACAYDTAKGGYSKSLYNVNTTDWDAVLLKCTENDITAIKAVLKPEGWQ